MRYVIIAPSEEIFERAWQLLRARDILCAAQAPEKIHPVGGDLPDTVVSELLEIGCAVTLEHQ